MTLNLVDMERWHVDTLIEDNDLPPEHIAGHVGTLLQCNSKTIMLDEQTPLACGGTVPMGGKRHLAWAIVSEKNAPAHMVGVTRLARKVMKLTEGRIEANVFLDFANGHRWMDALGFKPYAPLPQSGPDGEDQIGYVKFNGVH